MHHTSRLLPAIFVLASSSSLSQSTVKPVISPIYGSVHIVYSMTQVTKALSPAAIETIIAETKKNRPPHADEIIAGVSTRAVDHVEYTIPAQYWGKDAVCAWWRTEGKVSRSSLSDGTAWISAVEDPRRFSVAYYPVDRRAPVNQALYQPGVVAEEIPFLGFEQPGHMYHNAKSTLTKTATGWEENGKVLTGYKGEQDAILTYDDLGRLVRLQRGLHSPGVYEATYEYANFVQTASGTWLPRVIVRKDIEDVPNEPPMVGTTLTYTLQSFDTNPVPHERFSLQHPPEGTDIADYRYAAAPDMPLRYRFDGRLPVDAESPLQFKASQPTAASENTPRAQSPVGRLTPEQSQPVLLKVGTPAPDFTVTTSQGKTVRLSDYKGKIVVLDFWATWCGPCQQAMPHLEKVYQQVKHKGVTVLAVCDFDEKVAYDNWVKQNKSRYNFLTAFDPKGRTNGSIARSLYGVLSIPTQYIIDATGKVAAVHEGYDAQDNRLEKALTQLHVGIGASPLPSKP